MKTWTAQPVIGLEIRKTVTVGHASCAIRPIVWMAAQASRHGRRPKRSHSPPASMHDLTVARPGLEYPWEIKLSGGPLPHCIESGVRERRSLTAGRVGEELDEGAAAHQLAAERGDLREVLRAVDACREGGVGLGGDRLGGLHEEHAKHEQEQRPGAVGRRPRWGGGRARGLGRRSLATPRRALRRHGAPLRRPATDASLPGSGLPSDPLPRDRSPAQTQYIQITASL